MKSFYTLGLMALTAVLLPTVAGAQQRSYGSPSLLPLPSAAEDTASYGTPASWGGDHWSQPSPVSATAAPQNSSLVRTAPGVYPSGDPEAEFSPSDQFGGEQFGGDPLGHDRYGAPGAGSPYMDAMRAPWGQSCGACGRWPCGCRSGWFGGAYGLIMNRSRVKNVPLSFDTADESSKILGTRDVSMDWSGGVDVRGGRYFNQGLNAIEAVYWGVFPQTQEARAFGEDMQGSLNTTLNMSPLVVEDGMGGVTSFSDCFFDHAAEHRLRRSHEFHNVELNFLYLPLLGGPGCCPPPLQISLLSGIRFFRFREGLAFAGREFHSHDWEGKAGFYDISVVNNLVGAQLGGRIDYCLLDRLRLFAGTNFGLFGNHITHRSRIGTQWDDAFVGAGPNAGRAFNVRSHRNDVAFLGEANVGARYMITPRLSATAGYRAVALTGVALATDQFPRHFADIDSVANINRDGSLILHGGFFGGEYNY